LEGVHLQDGQDGLMTPTVGGTHPHSHPQEDQSCSAVMPSCFSLNLFSPPAGKARHVGLWI
jgi:hypothetical protein